MERLFIITMSEQGKRRIKKLYGFSDRKINAIAREFVENSTKLHDARKDLEQISDRIEAAMDRHAQELAMFGAGPKTKRRTKNNHATIPHNEYP